MGLFRLLNPQNIPNPGYGYLRFLRPKNSQKSLIKSPRIQRGFLGDGDYLGMRFFPWDGISSKKLPLVSRISNPDSIGAKERDDVRMKSLVFQFERKIFKIYSNVMIFPKPGVNENMQIVEPLFIWGSFRGNFFHDVMMR